MMKSKLATIVFIVIAAGTLILIIIFNNRQTVTYTSSPTSFTTNQVATVFVLGYGGSENSETFMVNQAVKKGVTKDITTAKVTPNGKVTFDTKLSPYVRNPIIKVEFTDNQNGDFNLNAQWIKNELTQLKRRYDIQQFNFVGHSMKNMSFAFYMKNNGIDNDLPQLKKEVNIAGVYNGVLNINDKVNEISININGKPSRINGGYK